MCMLQLYGPTQSSTMQEPNILSHLQGKTPRLSVKNQTSLPAREPGMTANQVGESAVIHPVVVVKVEEIDQSSAKGCWFASNHNAHWC